MRLVDAGVNKTLKFCSAGFFCRDESASTRSALKVRRQAATKAKNRKVAAFLLDFCPQESVCRKRKWGAFPRDFRAIARFFDPTLPELTLQPASLRFAGLCQWQHPMLSLTQGEPNGYQQIDVQIR